ncbi:MAG: hypothetical protein AB7T37_00780 [Dehalococcoidia bacterium]
MAAHADRPVPASSISRVSAVRSRIPASLQRVFSGEGVASPVLVPGRDASAGTPRPMRQGAPDYAAQPEFAAIDRAPWVPSSSTTPSRSPAGPLPRAALVQGEGILSRATAHANTSAFGSAAGGGTQTPPTRIGGPTLAPIVSRAQPLPLAPIPVAYSQRGPDQAVVSREWTLDRADDPQPAAPAPEDSDAASEAAGPKLPPDLDALEERLMARLRMRLRVERERATGWI